MTAPALLSPLRSPCTPDLLPPTSPPRLAPSRPIRARPSPLLLPGVSKTATRPSLQKRSVHGEMLIRKQILLPSLRHHRLEECLRDVAPQWPLPILAKYGSIPNRPGLVVAGDPMVSAPR